MRQYLLFTLLFLSVISLNAQSPTAGNKTLSLDDCMKIALENNYDIKISEARIDAGKASRLSAYGSYLPSIEASATYRRHFFNDYDLKWDPNTLTSYGIPEDQNKYSAGAMARYTIFDGLNRESKFKKAHSVLESYKLDSKHTIQSVMFQVYSAYIDVIKNQQTVNIRQDNFELGQEELKRIKAQYEAGVIPQSNVYAQEAELGNKEFSLVNAENQLNISKTDLMKILGMEASFNFDIDLSSIPNDLDSSEIEEFKNEYSSIGKLIRLAMENRYDIKTIDKRIESADADLTGARSTYMPRITANTYLDWFIDKSAFRTHDRNYDINFSVNFSIPIFDQFNTNTQIENAQLGLVQREIEKKQIEQNIRTSVQNAYMNLLAAEKQLEITKRTLVAANMNYESTKERYNIGAANITEFQTANNQLINSQINRINSVYSYILAQKQVLFAIGNL